MPIIEVKMYAGRSHAQKAELAKAITDAMVTIGKTPPEAVMVLFQDVPKEDWAQAGVLASDAK
jgi:4-oxalocrotonate tautomerase